jgi:hypothetical protein
MWLFVFGTGAVLLHLADWPGAASRLLPHAPPPWAPFALYFLVAALLRLAIRDARLKPLKRKAKALAADRAPSPMGVADFGMGVGKGVAAVVVGGDFLGAVWAGFDLLVKWLMGSRERSRRRVPAAVREAMAREKRRAVLCIAAVGLICGAQAVSPDLLPQAAAQAVALAGFGL